MTLTRFGRGAREVLLTLGALLGVLCIVASIAGVAFGVKPLVFRSGSMSPAIHTGDLAVSRTVDASDLKTADIVSVVNAEGSRVTHRIVNIASQGSSRQLTLKGDANKAADSEVYTVTKAERVLFDIPKAGYVVNAAASPVGVFVLGAYVMTMLLVLFRKRPGGDDDQHRQGRRKKAGDAESQPTQRRKGGARKADRKGSRSAARSIAVTAFAATVAVAAPAVAAPWTNPVAITGGAYSAATIVAPTTMTCAGSGLSSILTFTNLDPQYTYVVEYASSPTGPAEVTTYIAPAAGATRSHTVSSGLLGGLGGAIYARVYSVIKVGSNYVWKSTDFRGRRLNVSLILGNVTCSTAF